MKNSLSLILLLTTTTLAFAQGKLCFCNNTDNLIYFTTDTEALVRTDATSTANGTGTAFAIAGSGLYTGAGSTIAALAGSPLIIAGFLAGTSSNSLSLQTTTTIADASNEGQIVPVNMTLPFAAGTPIWCQVQVYDSRYGGGASLCGDGYVGASAIFQATPQASFYAPMWMPSAPVNSTWQPGTFSVIDMVQYGPGFYGGIEVWRPLDSYFGGFTAHPTDQTVVLGATTAFYVGVIACPPPKYQWCFNGGYIPAGTNSSLQISNVQMTNAGTYWVELCNPFWGGVTSSRATLTVLAAPIITSPPQSQAAEIGSSAGFDVQATNTMPLNYEWFFNSTIAITGSTTNCTLLLTNVQASQAGAYTVIVTNLLGAVTSGPVMLNVIAAVQRRPVPGVKVTGQTGSLLNVDCATALSQAPNWTTLGSVSLTSTSNYYFDLTLPLPPQGYYRAWQTGTPGVMPSLDLHLVPAITMTGNIGGSVRLDYINQFGPIDAWFTLDTVTLTNRSQLYFDTSAPGRPQRLYRLVPLP